MQCLTFVPYCMKCQKMSVLVFATAGWRAYTDHLHGLSGCCFEMQKNQKHNTRNYHIYATLVCFIHACTQGMICTAGN